MQERRLGKQVQRGVALTSVVTFLLMPVNLTYANEITAGNSGIGSLTDINNKTGNVTDITSNFVQNGTGINHFGSFKVDGEANLLGANRYVNMVDGMANINGILNAFQKTGQLPANVMFISPEGMAIGANGVLNVGGLQMITPTQADYKALINKAGNAGDPITAIMLTEADFDSLKAGGNAIVNIEGKVYSVGDVVIQAGNGIYFQDGSIITTSKGAQTLGDISLFTNTGDILDMGSNGEVRLDSSGNISISAKQGGVGEMMLYNQELNYGEATTVLPLNVKIADGKALNVEVADTVGTKGSYKGYASVANNSANLNIGTVKGANVKIENKGHGTLKTTENISDVGKIYLNAKNGMLSVDKDITAKEIVRLNGEVGVEAKGNLSVTDNGYVSVYSEDGGIDVNNVTLKSGNIDIKAKGGDVTFGNVTIQERGAAEGTLRLVDNKKLSTGIKAPDTFRFDGVHIVAENDNVIQKSGTQINSAGRTDLTAAGSIDATVKSVDLISATGGNTTLKTVDTARLGDITVSKLTVNGENILVDGKINSDSTIDINATDKLTVRPKTYLDETHRTYGVLNAGGDVNIEAQNGILATEQRPDGAIITSRNGDVNLNTDGDVKVGGADDKLTVSVPNGKVNATGDNVNLHLVDPTDNIGTIKAVKDANILGDGKIVVDNLVEAGENLTVEAVKDVEQSGEGVAFKSGKDMTLNSEEANVGQPEKYLSVEVGGKLDAEAPQGGVYINGNEEVSVGTITAGKDVEIEAGKILQDEAEESEGIAAGEDVTLKATTGDIGTTENEVKVAAGGELNAEAKSTGADVNLETVGDVEVGTIEADENVKIAQGGNLEIKEIVKAGNDVEIAGEGAILQAEDKATKPAISAGNDIKLESGKEDIGAADNYLTVDLGGELEASAPNGDVYIEGMGDLTVDRVAAGNDVNIKTPDNLTVKEAEAGNDINLEAGKDANITDAIAGNDVAIDAGEDVVIGNLVEAGNDLTVDAEGYIHQTKDGELALKSGEDMTLVSQTDNVGDPNKYLQVEVGGKLDAEAEQGGVYIGSPSDLTIDKVVAATDAVIDTEGYIHQVANGNKPAITTGNDLTLNSDKNDVGAPDNYLTVQVGGELDATAPEGGVYIEGLGDLNIDKVVAGEDVGLKADGNIHQVAEANPEDPRIIAGGDMKLESETKDVGDPDNYLQVQVGGQLDATAPEGGVYIGSKDDITIGEIVAGDDVEIETDGFIHQTDNGPRPAITAGDDLHLVSNKDNVGDPENYLTVKVGGDLDASAPEGGVYIEGLGDLNIDKIEAGEDVGLKADGNIHQIADANPDDPRIISGGDMKLESETKDVGDPDNYLQVQVGGQLDATAPEGGVYIGSKDNITIGQIEAGKDVGIESEGFIHQTDDGDRPAIIAGEDLHLKSDHDNVGDPENYLTVKVGDELDASAPEGGVYIEGYGDLTIDKIEAGEDVVVKGDEDIILPHDREDGNIEAGGDVTIEAGDSVLNEGGENPGIIADGDINITANENENEPAGTIGTLPYDDLEHSINVIVGGDVNVDEIGVPESEKILNVHIMGGGSNGGGSGSGDDGLQIDDRDQRSMKYLTDGDNDDASVRNNRQHLRYNVANSEYTLLDSGSESGAKVQDILNISKQGMLVETTQEAQLGEKIQLTVDYKGLPFTVEGEVVRTDAVKGTAGLEFKGIDRFTSSMLLYLGMMNGM